MNKNELIAAVAEKADLTKAQAGEAIDAALEAITASLKAAVMDGWLASPK